MPAPARPQHQQRAVLRTQQFRPIGDIAGIALGLFLPHHPVGRISAEQDAGLAGRRQIILQRQRLHRADALLQPFMRIDHPRLARRIDMERAVKRHVPRRRRRLALVDQAVGPVDPVRHRQQRRAAIEPALARRWQGRSLIVEGREQIPAPLPPVDLRRPAAILRPNILGQGEDQLGPLPMGQVAAGIGHDAGATVAGDGRVVPGKKPVGPALRLRHHPGIMDAQM